ncbi:MAG: hypothetical protein GY832_16405 [Chloroflexi bacterium]|nr:hypothetical protein [Chloroflexota bacterium]
MKKYLIVGIVLVVLVTSAGLGSSIWEPKELDDIAENGPIQSELVSPYEQKPLFEGILAAGISWDYDNERFFVSTDQPQRLFAKTASFYVVNAALDQILYQKDLEPDGDLEGIAYLGNNTVVMVSEIGTLYYLRDNGNEWIVTQSVAIFDGKGEKSQRKHLGLLSAQPGVFHKENPVERWCEQGIESFIPPVNQGSFPGFSRKHKLGSLAYDRDNEILYTAEKEGTKTIYQISRTGELIDSFELTAKNFTAEREFDMATDYTISGMSYSDQHLYILSEAYSTVFVFSLESDQIVRVYGVTGIHESAGITLKEDVACLVGDFESYLPPAQFYLVDMPK